VEDATGLRPYSPEFSVSQALQSRCAGIAWTYNEPAIWFEHTYDTAVLAKQKGLYTVYVTNGYSSVEALDKIAPYLDAFRVDIKGFSRTTYRKISGLGKWECVLRATERAKKNHGIHVECVTNVTPTINDSFDELRDIATWIRNGLGPETPWHVTRFHPHLDLSHLPPTPMSTLDRTFEIGKEEGLQYVYMGNVPGHKGQDTFCPSCGKVLVQRSGFGIPSMAIENGKCPDCGASIYGVWPDSE
jgi:pyruvate formate lyase activating enzyme